MKTEHTATPWKALKAQVGSTWVVYGPDDFPVASTPSNTTVIGMERSKAGVMQANAEFIVRACNAHDDLVKALQEAEKMLCQQEGELRHFGADSPNAEPAILAARAALAKAGAA